MSSAHRLTDVSRLSLFPPLLHQQRRWLPRRRPISPCLPPKAVRTVSLSESLIPTALSKPSALSCWVFSPVHIDDDVDLVFDIEDPWSHSYAAVTQDVVFPEPTCHNQRRHAQNWRSITTVQQLPTESVDVRPPSYAIHTTQPIPSDHGSEHLITPSTYQSDSLNAYAHLGMPKA